MKLRISLLILTLTLAFTAKLSADTLYMKDGSVIEGIIKKVSGGQVVVDFGDEIKVLDILAVDSMEFTTPHLVGATEGLPIDHFLNDIEAQEIVRNMKELEKAADEIRGMVTQIEMYWGARQPIAADELPSWEYAKLTFRRPLDRYQELLNDLYFHVLAKVDEYDRLMKDASNVYVGVQGLFRIGSPLVSKDMRQLPLRKYVPGAWYDTIYYDGYNAGYDDAYIKFAPHNSDSR